MSAACGRSRTTGLSHGRSKFVCQADGCHRCTWNGSPGFCSKSCRAKPIPSYYPSSVRDDVQFSPNCNKVEMLDPRDIQNPTKCVGVIAFYYADKDELCDTICGAGFLGNFFALQDEPLTLEIKAGGFDRPLSFLNAEAAFQALKFPHKARLFTQLTGTEAFRKKQELYGDEDRTYAGCGNNWKAMFHVLRQKFKSGTQFADGLKKTGDCFLLEHNSFSGRDKIWSDNRDGDGTNWLGLQLMVIRDELNTEVGGWTKFIQRAWNMEDGSPTSPQWQKKWQDAVRTSTRALGDAIPDKYSSALLSPRRKLNTAPHEDACQQPGLPRESNAVAKPTEERFLSASAFPECRSSKQQSAPGLSDKSPKGSELKREESHQQLEPLFDCSAVAQCGQGGLSKNRRPTDGQHRDQPSSAMPSATSPKSVEAHKFDGTWIYKNSDYGLATFTATYHNSKLDVVGTILNKEHRRWILQRCKQGFEHYNCFSDSFQLRFVGGEDCSRQLSLKGKWEYGAPTQVYLMPEADQYDGSWFSESFHNGSATFTAKYENSKLYVNGTICGIGPERWPCTPCKGGFQYRRACGEEFKLCFDRGEGNTRQLTLTVSSQFHQTLEVKLRPKETDSHASNRGAPSDYQAGHTNDRSSRI